MVRIILIRHGETTWNVEGRYQGQEDTPLSDRGLDQGRKVAHALENYPIDRFIASPLSRALNTCRFCAEHHGKAVQTDKRLIEIHHGDWEGVLAEDIKMKYADLYAAWQTAPETVLMPGEGGESLEDVRRRVREAFDEYVARYEGETVAIVAHDAVNKAIICDVLGLGMEHFWQIKQDNTCINVLEYANGAWRMVLLNSTTHLGFLFSGIEQKGL